MHCIFQVQRWRRSTSAQVGETTVRGRRKQQRVKKSELFCGIRRETVEWRKKLWNYAESYKAQINPLRIRQGEWEWEEKYA
jgi:hypothetical protein